MSESKKPLSCKQVYNIAKQKDLRPVDSVKRISCALSALKSEGFIYHPSPFVWFLKGEYCLLNPNHAQNERLDSFEKEIERQSFQGHSEEVEGNNKIHLDSDKASKTFDVNDFEDFIDDNILALNLDISQLNSKIDELNCMKKLLKDYFELCN